jgi:predicted PurR-regulated permease PerM
MNPENKLNQPFVTRLLIIVGVILAAILLIVLVYFTIDVLLLVFGAVLLAIFLRGLSDLVNRYTRLSEGLSVALVSILLIAIIAGAIALLAPSVAEQVRHLRVELPKSANQAREYISQFSWGKAIFDQIPSTDEITKNIDASSIVTRVGGVFSSTIGAIGNFFIVILIAIYFASEPRFYARGFIKLFPIENRARVREILIGIFETLRWWLIGKAGSMIFIAILTWVGLSIMGVPLALTLGLIAGLLSFIPNFGPILSAIPAILLAFIDSPISALYVLALYVGVQLIESNIVTPLIERETVELPPALTIVFQLALGILIGGLGLVLATPILAVVMVLVQMIYIQDVLGDKDTEVEHKDLDETNSREIEAAVSDV